LPYYAILCHIYQLNTPVIIIQFQRITIHISIPRLEASQIGCWKTTIKNVQKNTTICCIISQKKKTHTHTLHPNFPMFNLLALIDNPTGLKKMSELSGIEI
jgi:hypothetical protein